MAADVDTALYSWSTSESSNKPTGSTTIGANLDDNLRQIQATVRAWLANKGADIASASTTDLGAVAGLAHDITGTTTITSFGTVAAGIWKIIKFEGALTLTHNGTSLILPGAENITTADGDIAIFISEGSGNWRCVSYFPAAINPAKIVSTDEAQTLTNKTLTSATLTTPTINTAASVGGSWTAAATWTLPAHTLGGTITLNGQSFSGAASFSSSVAITGDVAVATNKFTVASASGNTSIAGTLDVTGNIVTSAMLGVGTTASANRGINLVISAGPASSSGVYGSLVSPTRTSASNDGSFVGYSTRMTVNASAATVVSVDGFYFETLTLTAGTVTNINGYRAPDITVSSTRTASFLTEQNSGSGKWAFLGTGTANSAFNGNVRIGSTTAPTVALDVTGAALVSSTLGVTGAATLSSTLAVTGNVTINTNKFTVTASSGDTTIAGKATVTGDLVGGSGESSTSRTTGFVYASVVSGPPTSTPTGGPLGNGSGALAWDYNGGALYIYNHSVNDWNVVVM